MKLKTPIAPKNPHTSILHEDTRVDEYAWLRDDNWQSVMQSPTLLQPDIRAYLESENAYTEACMQDTDCYQTLLYEEMKARIKDDDASVPCRDGEYYYYQRYAPGAQHACYYRRDANGCEQLLLDADLLAKQHDYFDIGECEHSPDHRYLAYCTDTKGSEFYTLYIIDLSTATQHPQTIDNIQGNFVWAMDSRTLFYTTLDENHRPDKVYRHQLDTTPEPDQLVYQEHDAGFFVGLDRTESNRYILIAVHDHTTTEIHTIDAYHPCSAAHCFQPRLTDIEYSISDREQLWYITTNKDSCKNFKLMTAPLDATAADNWQDLYLPESQCLLRGILLFKDYMVRLERIHGLPKITVLQFAGQQQDYTIAFDEEAYELDIDGGFEFDTECLRFSYTSMTTPTQIFDFNMSTRTRQLRKQQEIPSGHNSTDYITQRIFAKTKDGSKIPISLLYRKDTPLDGRAPCLLYGYGSYGASMPASFSSTRLSLVERGFVYAIAHVRGGMELGYDWYTAGKLKHKKNTFSDFIAVAETLIDQRYTCAGNITIHGGSAGGMLIGAVLNLRAELFKCAIADVPFVDVLTTMCDASLPLTPPEWPEWGNPLEESSAYAYIKSYSPYDNVHAQAYPHILVTAGLTDPRVTYWEPAKWVARLRASKTDDNTILLKTNMEAGHGGASGRFDSLKEMALMVAFILKSYDMIATEDA